MPLSVDSEIKAIEIDAAKKLDPVRPVYLLIGQTSKVVIKRDMAPQARDPQNMRYANRNMKVVDRTMATKQLTRAEVEAVSNFVQGKIFEFERFSQPLTEVISKLETDIDMTAGVVWVKTNFFEGLVNLEAAAQLARTDGDKSGIKAITAALKAPGGLEKLGQILAVDAFNGNDDRFYFGDDGSLVPLPYIRLTNAGNVGLCLQDDVLQPVGMDAYAGMAEFRSLASADRPPREWSGYRLLDTAAPWRQQFALDVAADIEEILGPRARRNPFGSTNRLPDDAGARIAQGINEGIVKLKVAFAQMFGPDNRPPGLQARLLALNWAVVSDGMMRPPPPPGLPPSPR